MEKVNGKVYNLWGQFVDQEKEWIGGELEDLGDAIDRAILKAEGQKTVITAVTLKPNGEDSAMFSVEGKDFTCGFDARHGGVIAGEDGWITFSGYLDHQWRIKKPVKA